MKQGLMPEAWTAIVLLAGLITILTVFGILGLIDKCLAIWRDQNGYRAGRRQYLRDNINGLIVAMLDEESGAGFQMLREALQSTIAEYRTL